MYEKLKELLAMKYTCEMHRFCVVQHDSEYCPICEMERELAELRKENDILQEEVYSLQEDLENMDV
jgi:cell division protein FtsB